MNIIIYGTGSLAKQLYYFLKYDSQYNVVAFCVDKEYLDCLEFCNLPVVTFENIESIYPSYQYEMLITVGYRKMRNRKIIFENVKAKGYELINYIHSSVINHNLILGENNIIYPGCVIEPGVTIGDNNIIWSMSLLSHDVKIGSHNYIAAKCLIGGNCIMDDLCFIGNGTIFVDGLVISKESQIIAGIVVLRKTKESGVYLGNPAKLFKINENGIEIK